MKLLKSSYCQSAFLSTGTIVNSFLGLIFYVLVARNLGPQDFGVFSLFLGIGMMAAEITDWGFGAAIIKFGTDKEKLSQIMGTALIQRTIVFLILLLVTISFSKFILSFFVALSLSVLAVFTQCLLAQQKYLAYTTTNICGNVLRLILLIIFTANFALPIFIGANFFAIIIGFLLNKIYPVFGHNNYKEVWQFSRFAGGSLAVSSLASKLDVPIIFALGGAVTAGIYSSAQKLTSVFSQIAVSLEGVFSPKFSNGEKALKQYLVPVILVIIGIVVFMPFSDFVINLVFGEKYLMAIPVFKLLLLGLIFFFLAGPFNTFLVYHKGKTNYQFVNSILSSVTMISLYFLLVPNFGAEGAALSFIFACVLQMILVMGEYLWLK